MSRIPPTSMQQSYDVEGLTFRVRQLEAIINGELDFGYPDDGTGAQQLLNLRGAWVTVTLTSSAELGTGASSPITFTHNLNLPVQQNAAGDDLPNVTWPIMRVVYGDKTGANAAPAPGANARHTSIHFNLGDSVTADAIQLRVHSGLTLGATTPLNIDVFFHPAVQ